MQKNQIAEELIIMKSKQVIQSFQLFETDGVLTIGRHVSNDIKLPDDPKISRVHAAIVRYDPETAESDNSIPKNEKVSFFLRDLGSAHGTKVGGKFVHKRLLQKGDVIRISDYTILFGNKKPVQEETGIPFDERYGSFPSESTYKMETVIRKASAGFTDEQEEFLSNISSGGLSDDFLEQPGVFLKQMLDLMKAQNGILGFYRESRIITKAEVGFERENPRINPTFVEKLFQDGPIRQEAALWMPLPMNHFLIVIRSRPPAFGSNDLDFVNSVSEHLSSLKTFGDNLFERTAWPINMVGLADLKKEARDIADSEDSRNNDILIMGETGTGKEVLARYIHSRSPRKSNPFEARNCANFTRELISSELFGHSKGAFSGANENRSGAFMAANTGVLLLDEIGELPGNIQAVLLRALQEREINPVGSDKTTPFDIRIIAATNSDLEKDIADGLFRQDLYSRFTHKKTIPPLRERKEDITVLAYYFLDKYSRKTQSISREALKLLRRYDWPGNVRELQNVMKSRELRNKEIIFSWDLPAEIRSAAEIREVKESNQKTLKELEKQRIIEVLEETRGNRERAIKILGISRATLFNKFKQHAISKDLGKPKRR